MGRLDGDLTRLRPPIPNAFVQYRPGFMTAWRHFRAVYRTVLETPGLARQHRLTAAIARIRRVAGFAYLRLLELSFGHVSRQSLLGGGGVWRLNGGTCANPFAQLYAGDVLTRSGARKGTAAYLQGRGDAPSHLEVDELTQSCTLLYEPTRAGQLGSLASRAPFLTHRLYN